MTNNSILPIRFIRRNSIIKTVRIENHSLLFGGTFFLQPDRPFYFSEPRREKQKTKIRTRNPGDTMGVSGYGSFFCLWAVRARSARGRVFTEPWATPPTACAMKIEREVVYNPTIHHGYLLLEKNCHPGRRQPWPLHHLPTGIYGFSGFIFGRNIARVKIVP